MPTLPWRGVFAHFGHGPGREDIGLVKRGGQVLHQDDEGFVILIRRLFHAGGDAEVPAFLALRFGGGDFGGSFSIKE